MLRAWQWIMLWLASASAALAVTNTTIHLTNKWAWSSGAGWINCRTDVTNGMAVGEYVLSGFMYSSTVGWIHLGYGAPSNGLHYSNASSTDYGVNHDAQGHLTGYAWNESAGWINFGWTNNPDAANAPKLNLQSGIFSGYAWGGSLGWISLSNMSARLQTVSMATGIDANSNSIPDAWEIDTVGSTNRSLGGTNALGQPKDSDADGSSDVDEYVADTCPTNPYDCLQLTALSLTGTDIELVWDSRKTRFYYVDRKTNLMDSTWLDSGFGLISSDTETNTVQQIPADDLQEFFRIRAVKPFSY